MATNPTGTEGSSAVLTATDLDLIVSVVELLKVEKNKSPSRMIPAKLEVTLSAEDLLLLAGVERNGDCSGRADRTGHFVRHPGQQAQQGQEEKVRQPGARQIASAAHKRGSRMDVEPLPLDLVGQAAELRCAAVTHT